MRETIPSSELNEIVQRADTLRGAEILLDQDPARRMELAEETGIVEISIDDTWGTRTQYTFRRKGSVVPKQVYWYIAETSELDVTLSHEHTNYLWLDFDAAEAQLTFEQEKDILRSARSHLQQMGKAV